MYIYALYFKRVRFFFTSQEPVFFPFGGNITPIVSLRVTVKHSGVAVRNIKWQVSFHSSANRISPIPSDWTSQLCKLFLSLSLSFPFALSPLSWILSFFSLSCWTLGENLIKIGVRTAERQFREDDFLKQSSKRSPFGRKSLEIYGVSMRKHNRPKYWGKEKSTFGVAFQRSPPKRPF